jgi:hypothetical protein
MAEETQTVGQTRRQSLHLSTQYLPPQWLDDKGFLGLDQDERQIRKFNDKNVSMTSDYTRKTVTVTNQSTQEWMAYIDNLALQPSPTGKSFTPNKKMMLRSFPVVSTNNKSILNRK